MRLYGIAKDGITVIKITSLKSNLLFVLPVAEVGISASTNP